MHSRTSAAELNSIVSLADRLSESGDRPAVVEMASESSRNVSFAELSARVQRGAHVLQQAGLGSGDRVVLWAENSTAWIAAALAVIRAGGVATPLDVQLDREALKRILEDSRPEFLCVTAERLPRLDELECTLPRMFLLDEESDEGRPPSLWAGDSGDSALPDVEPDDPAVLFYTSGTTGPSKGVPLTHRNLVFQLNRVAETGLALPTDRFLVPLPFHHVYPFSLGLLLPLSQELPIVLPRSLTGAEIARAAKEGKATVLLGVPRLHRALLDALEARLQQAVWPVAPTVRGIWGLCEVLRRKFRIDAGRFLLAPVRNRIGPHLRVLASGGGPLDPVVGARLEALGWDVAIGYGLTETAPLLTLNPPGSGRLSSVGRPLDGVEIRIEPEAEEQGQRELGEVLARGPNVFAGYRNLPEKTGEAFTEDGWFRTGDLGRWEEGGYLAIEGRVSTRIVTESGENVQPEEVEEVYETSPAIREVGILEDEGRLVGLIVPEPDVVSGREDRTEAIGKAIEERSEALPSHQRLTDFALTGPSLPRTRLGKIRRHLLAERYRKAREGDEGRHRREPLPLEEMSGEDRALLENRAAREAWELLCERYPDQGLTPESRLDLDLGIDSLDWLGLAVQVSERTGVHLEEETITSLESVRDLLQEVAEGEAGGEAAEALRPLEAPEETLEASQKRWLEPPGPFLRSLGWMIHPVLRLAMHRLFRLQVEGRERLPAEGPYVIAPNHLSALDPPAIAAVLDRSVLERTYWAGWTGIAFRNPAARLLSRTARVVPVEPQRAVASSLAFAAAVIRRDGNLIWFPEGRRSPDGDLQEFRPGLGMLLQHYPVPVVPALLSGTREALPPGRHMPRLRPVRLIFGEPLDPRSLAEEGEGKEARDRIVQALREEVAALGRDRA